MKLILQLLFALAVFAAGTGLPTNANATPQFYITNQCYLPGPAGATSHCTIHWKVWNNQPNYIICLWDGNTLHMCEATQTDGEPYKYVTASGTNLEFRHHNDWPQNDPDWPNQAVVKSHGTLLYSKTVHAIPRPSANAGACNLTLSPGADIPAAISSQPSGAVICLETGLYFPTTNIEPKTNQVIMGLNPTQRPTIYRADSNTDRIFTLHNSGIIIKNLVIQGSGGSNNFPLAEYGILVYNSSNIIVDNVLLDGEKIPLGATASSSNVDVRNSEIFHAGDGNACSGCADPSVYISDSSNIRFVNLTVTGNGVGPEGDGAFTCYNSKDVLLQDSSFQDVGASGVYMVNCDQALLLNNEVQGSKEWGLDIVETGYSSGSDFGLYDGNIVYNSRSGAAVLRNSTYNTFTSNDFRYNRVGPDPSGSCDGLNKRGNTTGTTFFPTYFGSFPSLNNQGSNCND